MSGEIIFKKSRNYLKNKPKFSVFALALFILTFSAAGIYLYYNSQAETPTTIASSAIPPESDPSIYRLWGEDRYATAAGITRKMFPEAESSGYIVLASGEDESWPDGLTSGPLAARFRGSILLTRKDKLPKMTRYELRRQMPKVVFITGGTGVVSTAVENEVKSLGIQQVSRFAGSDRYDTAYKVAYSLWHNNGRKINDNTAIVVSGTSWPDAVSASPVASAKGYPIL